MSCAFRRSRRTTPWARIFAISKFPSAINLLIVRVVTSLDLVVGLRAPGRDVAMSDADFGEMPSELRTGGRILVGLDQSDSEGQTLTDHIEEGLC